MALALQVVGAGMLKIVHWKLAEEDGTKKTLILDMHLFGIQAIV